MIETHCSRVEALGLSWTVEVVEDTEVDSRRRTRTCSLSGVARRAALETSGSALPGWAVGNGGTVANSYGYSATTQVVAAIADRATLTVWVWRSSAPANKTTARGSALSSGAPECLAVLEDGRVSRERRTEARRDLFEWVAEARSDRHLSLEIKGAYWPHLLTESEAVAYDAVLESL